MPNIQQQKLPSKQNLGTKKPHTIILLHQKILIKVFFHNLNNSLKEDSIILTGLERNKDSYNFKTQQMLAFDRYNDSTYKKNIQ